MSLVSVFVHRLVILRVTVIFLIGLHYLNGFLRSRSVANTQQTLKIFLLKDQFPCYSFVQNLAGTISSGLLYDYGPFLLIVEPIFLYFFLTLLMQVLINILFIDYYIDRNLP